MSDTGKRTNEQIDKINAMRDTLGEEKLPYENEDNGGGSGSGELTEEEKKAVADQLIIDAKKKEDEEKAAANGKDGGKEKIAPAVELDDAAVLAYLKKTKGKDFDSLDAILNPKTEPSADDKEKEAQQRENNKMAYALKEGKFSKKELENFIHDSRNPQELVFHQYAQEQKKEDADLTDDEIKAEFEEKYGLDQKEGSRKYKRGQIELQLLANNLIGQKHSKIINFDNEYAGIETDQLTQKQTQQKIISQAPAYKKDVEEIYSELKSITVNIAGSNYKVDVPQEILDAQKATELDENYAAGEIKNGWTKEAKKNTAQAAIIMQNLPFIMERVADQYHLSKVKGTHGIPPVGDFEKVDKQKTERQATLKKYHGSSVTEQATN